MKRSRPEDGPGIALVAVVVATLAGWAPPPARAQGHDGQYAGHIVCDQIPGQTRGPLKTTFSMSIEAGRARYEREVLRPEDNQKLGVTERGGGTVSPSGEVSLTGSVVEKGWGYEAAYRGHLEGRSIELSGTQNWRLPGRSNHERACTIRLSR